jgi:hypothetical protein
MLMLPCILETISILTIPVFARYLLLHLHLHILLRTQDNVHGKCTTDKTIRISPKGGVEPAWTTSLRGIPSALRNAPGIVIIIVGFLSVFLNLEFLLRLLWGEIRGHERFPLPHKIIVAWWQWSMISRLHHPRTPNVFRYKLALDDRAMEVGEMELITYG